MVTPLLNVKTMNLRKKIVVLALIFIQFVAQLALLRQKKYSFPIKVRAKVQRLGQNKGNGAKLKKIVQIPN
jgi:hypothetical protein